MLQVKNTYDWATMMDSKQKLEWLEEDLSEKVKETAQERKNIQSKRLRWNSLGLQNEIWGIWRRTVSDFLHGSLKDDLPKGGRCIPLRHHFLYIGKRLMITPFLDSYSVFELFVEIVYQAIVHQNHKTTAHKLSQLKRKGVFTKTQVRTFNELSNLRHAIHFNGFIPPNKTVNIKIEGSTIRFDNREGVSFPFKIKIPIHLVESMFSLMDSLVDYVEKNKLDADVKRELKKFE